MDHDRLKCWVPLHRALELLGLRSHRKLLQLAAKGRVQIRTGQGRRYFWSEEIERLADDRDRTRSETVGSRLDPLEDGNPSDSIPTPGSLNRSGDRPRGRPRSHRRPRDHSRSDNMLPLTGLSGEEMTLLSEPVFDQSTPLQSEDGQLQNGPLQNGVPQNGGGPQEGGIPRNGTALNGHAVDPAPSETVSDPAEAEDRPVDSELVRRIEDQLGAFRTSLEHLQKTVEEGARPPASEVVEAEVIPPGPGPTPFSRTSSSPPPNSSPQDAAPWNPVGPMSGVDPMSGPGEPLEVEGENPGAHGPTKNDPDPRESSPEFDSVDALFRRFHAGGAKGTDPVTGTPLHPSPSKLRGILLTLLVVLTSLLAGTLILAVA